MSHDNITAQIIGENAIDSKVAYSPEVVGKECIGCHKALPFIWFKPDSSYRDGRRDLCSVCESAPRLSTEEHTHRLREMNYNSEAVKRQRWEDQDEFRNDDARQGSSMLHSDLLAKLRTLVPDLYITDGRIEGDLAVFRTYGQPQPRLEGRTFEYLFYVPTGLLPEFSQYEFDTVRDIPIKEKKRGWRTVLLRLIKTGLLKESDCNRVFGVPSGPASTIWHRELYKFRNRTT